MKSLLSAGTFSPIAVLKIYLPKGQVVRAFSFVPPIIYLSRAIGQVGISSPDGAHQGISLKILHKMSCVKFLTFMTAGWQTSKTIKMDYRNSYATKKIKTIPTDQFFG